MRPVDREWVPPGIARVTVRIMPASARPFIVGHGRFRRLRRSNRLYGFGCGSRLRGFGGGRHDRGPRHADRRRLDWSCCRCRGRTSGRCWSGGILGMAAKGGGSDKKRCDGETHNTRLHLNDPLSSFGGHGPGLARANLGNGRFADASRKSARRGAAGGTIAETVTARRSWCPW